MSTLHTPGPWFQGPQSANGWHTVRVADVGCTHGRIVAETVETEDARLIAASPDLLLLAYQYLSDLRYPPTGDSLQRRIERAEKVIASATGAA